MIFDSLFGIVQIFGSLLGILIIGIIFEEKSHS